MHHRWNSKGFTLIEILVAILLFAVGALAAARMQATSLRSTTFGKEALEATTAAQRLMEQLKELAVKNQFGTILAGSGTASVKAGNTPTNIQDGSGGPGNASVSGMTIQWGVSNTSGVTPYRCTTVKVTVRWAGNTRNYTTNTIISERQ